MFKIFIWTSRIWSTKYNYLDRSERQKIDSLKLLPPNRKYCERSEALEFSISAHSLIERVHAPFAG